MVFEKKKKSPKNFAPLPEKLSFVSVKLIINKNSYFFCLQNKAVTKKFFVNSVFSELLQRGLCY